MLLITVCWRRGGSTDSKSFAFKHLDEAFEHQAEYGGRINKITQMEMNEEVMKEKGRNATSWI